MQWIARFSRTHIVIAVATLFAFVSTFAYLQSLDKTMSVASLSKNVNSGQTITENEVTFVQVSFDEKISSELITPDELKDRALIARTDLSKSNLLSKSNTIRQSSEEGLQSLSLGLDIERANGGDVKKGDKVNIWRTGEQSHLVASSVSVRNVILPNKRLGVSTTKTITIVVAVTNEQAKDLSFVIGSKDIMIVISNSNSTEIFDSKESLEEEHDNGFQSAEIGNQ